MEITSLDDTDLFDLKFGSKPQEPPLWEKTSQAAWCSFLVLSCCLAPNIFKKKRQITLQSSSMPPEPPEPIPLEDLPEIVQTPKTSQLSEDEKKEPLSVPTKIPRLSDDEQTTAQHIFRTLAEGSTSPFALARLPFKRTNLNKLGVKIQDVHPFSLIIEIHEPICTIIQKNVPFIQNGARQGLIAGFEKHRDTLLSYTEDLSDQLNKDKKIIDQYIKQQNWDELIDYLFKQ